MNARLAKRIALVVVALLVAVVGGFAAMMASVFSGNMPLPETGPIAGGKATLIKDGYVSAYAVPVGGGHVVLVDCGNDPAATAVLAATQGAGLVVDGIFLTHAHPDHTNGCAAVLAAFPQAFVAASKRELPALAGAPFAGLLPRLVGNKPSGLTVTRPLADVEDIVVGGVTVHAVSVVGHTAGSMVYVANGVVFLGDAATSADDGHVKAPPGPFSDDVGLGVASLHLLAEALRTQGVTHLAFAHAGPLPGDLTKLAAVQP